MRAGDSPPATRTHNATHCDIGERSMRAGDSPPATPATELALHTSSHTTFNESRGFTPGNTRSGVQHRRRPAPFNESRGFTPGNTPPRCVSLWRPPRSFNESRGFTPGNTTPPTRVQRTRNPFNESRGFTPGNTWTRSLSKQQRLSRSMRAGDSPPATLHMIHPFWLCVGSVQ